MKNKEAKTPIERLTDPIQEFLHQEASGGILLIIATIIALVWANSPFADSYHHLWHTYLTISLGGLALNYSIHHWINDGLMVIFFFVVGLEIKRELLVGELSCVKKAAFPIAAALGGMIFPALIYTIINAGGEGTSGWGIPMATDIAFVVGILALLGKRVPLALKIFILALAIVDDLGAVLVIAIFYTSDISFTSLYIAGGLIVLLIAMNKLGVRNLLIYIFVGIGLWLAFLKSGVHATVAGVLLAFTIPVSSRINTIKFKNETESLLQDFDNAGEHGDNVLTNSVSIGIILGLFLVKQIGIFSFSYLAVKLKFASEPEGVSWKKIYAAAIISGIGFTMSLFIANLAFTSPELLDTAKVGVLSGSLISGIIGFIILKSALSKK